MSQFSIPITPEARRSMTLLPPPPYTPDGDILCPSDDVVSRYGDIRQMKQRTMVRIEEELYEVAAHADGNVYYILTVVCMSSRADLDVILASARHLGLVSRADVIYDYKEELDPQYEKNCIEVRCEIGYETLQTAVDGFDDSAVMRDYPIRLSLGERRRIWMGLFEAAGYRAQWGGTLNVRKTHI